jgi:hypothetical protein
LFFLVTFLRALMSYGDMQNVDSPIACEFLYKLQMYYKMFNYGMVYCVLGDFDVTFVVVEY